MTARSAAKGAPNRWLMGHQSSTGRSLACELVEVSKRLQLVARARFAPPAFLAHERRGAGGRLITWISEGAERRAAQDRVAQRFGHLVTRGPHQFATDHR